MRLVGHIALLAGLVLAIGCGSSDSASSPQDHEPATCDGAAPYAVKGAYVAGVTTYDRAGIPIEVWYPADSGAEAGKTPDVYDMREWLPASVSAQISDADAPLHATDAYRDIPASSAARFPIVLFSHGLGGYRSQSSFLMTHLASWGFVVVAPEHPERGLAAVLGGEPLADNSSTALLDALEMLKSEDTRTGGRLEGRLDFGHVAVSGHSMGGGATMVVAPDPQIHTWFTLASPAPGSAPGKPFLMMAGMTDNVAVIDEVRQGYTKKAAPKRFAAISSAGHLAFTDICTIARDQGGLFGLAQKYGVEVNDLLATIGSDGCHQENLPAEEGWPIIDHYVTAHLRAAFSIDAPPAGLDGPASACFSGLVAEFATE